ncbi:MAG: phosphotransacetylase [Ignavibacteria bacterium]|nr:phosphotransacetylase [Ignavibacteria bacterium]
MSSAKDILGKLEEKAVKKRRTIILPESDDIRVIDAVHIILRRRIANVILLQKQNELENRFKARKDLTIIDTGFGVQYANDILRIRRSKDPSYSVAAAESESVEPLVFSMMLLKKGFADGVIAGSVCTTSDVIRQAISIVGIEKGYKTVSSFFLFSFPRDHKLSGRVFAFADAGVIPVPTAEQLSDIAIHTAKNFKKLTGLKPRVAFLSFSTKGSARHDSLKKISDALELTKKRNRSLIVDGELQFDAAFVPSVAARKNKGGAIKGDANVFIFPDLNSANIAYKITERIGGAYATGPILQGLSRPVMDLSRGCSTDDIVNMAKVITNF